MRDTGRLKSALRLVLRAMRIVFLPLLWLLIAVAWVIDHVLVRSQVGFDGYVERRVEEQRLMRTFDEERHRGPRDRDS